MTTIVHEVSMPALVANLTLKVRFMRTAKVRLWLGARIVRFGAFVAGTGCEIELAD
jgi:hypothetical protein